mgnify:CR=1 FL=1
MLIPGVFCVSQGWKAEGQEIDKSNGLCYSFSDHYCIIYNR